MSRKINIKHWSDVEDEVGNSVIDIKHRILPISRYDFVEICKDRNSKKGIAVYGNTDTPVSGYLVIQVFNSYEEAIEIMQKRINEIKK